MDITVPTLTASDVIPGIYGYIQYGAGPISGASNTRRVLVIGNADSAITSTTLDTLYGADTNVVLNGVQDAETLFGARSELCEMYRQVVRCNPNAVVYAYPIPEDSGGAKDVKTITITTTATSTGVVKLRYCDYLFEVAVTTGDTPTVIAGKIVSAFNANTRIPAVASNVAGVVSITFTHKGKRGSLTTLAVNNVTTVNTDQTLLGSTYNINKTASGFVAGSGSDTLTNLVANLAGYNFYYWVCPHCYEDGSATDIAAIASHLTTEALPVNNNIQRAFTCDTSSSVTNAQTVATTLNNPLVDVVWSKGCWTLPSKLIAQIVGCVSAFEAQAVPLLNWNDFGARADSSGLFDATFDSTVAKPTRAEQTTAYANGVSVFGLRGRQPAIYKLITSYCLNGTQPDYRVRDHHIVTVLHFLLADLMAACGAVTAGRVIKDNVPTGQPIPPQCVTPNNIRGAAVGVVQGYFDNGLIENIQAVLNSIVIARSSNPDSRMGIQIEADVAAILNQLVVRVNHVG